MDTLAVFMTWFLLQQVTLITRVLEGDEPAPRVIVHDYTVNGRTATLSYSLPDEVTVWKITLQTSKDARLAETIRISRDDEHAIELARLEAEIGRLRHQRPDRGRARRGPHRPGRRPSPAHRTRNDGHRKVNRPEQ